jgi:signal transduction histidine kinase
MEPLTDPYGLDVLQPYGDKEITQTAPTDPDTIGRLERELQKTWQFASDASHELRTPVAGLRAELEEAQMHPDQTDLGDLLDRALNDVDRLEAIIKDLLVLAETEAGPPMDLRRVDLGELVKAEVSGRKDRIAVELELQPGVTVNAVPTQIGRVLTNLLNNAQRHAERTVRIQVSRDGDNAELAVTDDGDGIAEADRERIFQRFTRLDAARRRDHKVGHKGTGLGLAISHDIAEAHAGSLEVGDSVTGGARFVLRLPLAASSRLVRPAKTVTRRCRRGYHRQAA